MPINVNAGGVTIDLDLGLHKFNQQLKAAQRMFATAAKAMQTGAAQSQAILLKAQAQAAQAPFLAANHAAVQLVRARTHAATQQVRATAAALATQHRAQGSVNAQMVRAQGAASAARIRAVGSIASGSIRALAAPINAVTRPLAAVVSAVSRLGSLNIGGIGLGSLLGIGGGIGGVLSVKKIADDAIDMERMQARLGRAAGMTGADLEGLGKSLRNFASATAGVSTDKIFSFATFGARLGIAGPQLELFTHDMTKMAQVFEDIDPETAATRIVRLVNVFGRGHDETIKFVSAINALDLASTATATDILDVTSRLAGMGAFLGMRPQQALALATALREANVPIETAGTSISQILGRMASGEHTRDFGKVAGMGGQQFRALATSDPLKALQAFLGGLARMDKAKGIDALDKLSLDGQRVRGSLLLLLPVLDKLDKFVKVADDEWESLRSIMSSVASVVKTTWAALEKVRNNFGLMSAELGKGLLPAIKGLGEGLVNLFIDVRQWAERNRETFERWGQKIGDALRYVGVLFREWENFRDLGASFLIEGWQKAKEVALRLFGRDGMVWANMKVGWNNALEAMADGFPRLMDYLLAVFEHYTPRIAVVVGNALKDGFILAAQALTPLIKGFLPGGEKLAKFILGMKPTPAGEAPKLGDFFKDFGQKIQPFPGFGGLFGGLPARFAERALIRGQIRRGMGRQDVERAAEEADLEAGDAAARDAAARGRLPNPMRDFARRNPKTMARMRARFINNMLRQQHADNQAEEIERVAEFWRRKAIDPDSPQEKAKQRLRERGRKEEEAMRRAGQAAAGPVGQMFMLAMLGGFKEDARRAGVVMRGGAGMMSPVGGALPAGPGTIAGRAASGGLFISSGADFPMIPSGRKAGQAGFAPAAGGGQGAGQGVGRLNMLGDLWNFGQGLGRTIGEAAGEFLYRKQSEINALPAGKTAAVSDRDTKLLVAIQDLKKSIDRLTNPGGGLGYYS